MSVVTFNSMETDKVGPIATQFMPELIKNCDIPFISREEEEEKQEEEDQPAQADIWNLIQSQKPNTGDLPPPYIHPLVRRSSSSLSQKSLEICTESLGSETGSDNFLLSSFTTTDSESETESEEEEDHKVYVKNHQEIPYRCNSAAAVSRKSPPRSFPPPLQSISSRNGGPILRMRPLRSGDGRLVMEAVSVPSQNHLRARRHDGRLLLSFTEEMIESDEGEIESSEESSEAEEEMIETESEEEEEVEVVDRGTMIEVNVSTQPNHQLASKKVHRSSFVINKFVGSSADDAMTAAADTVHGVLPPSRRRSVAMLTTAAAAVAAASALSASSQYEESHVEEEEEEEEGQALFVATTAGSRRRSKEELLHQMRRCSQLRRPLFIWEPRCIAT